MTTIKDIARKANVTHGTVSRALNGDPRVAPKTREKVLKAAKTLGYSPSAQAVSLVRGCSSAIGIILHRYSMLQHYVTSNILIGIGKVLENNKKSMLLECYDEAKEIPDMVSRLLRGRHVDGVIIIGGVPAEEEAALNDYKQNIVYANASPISPHIHSVEVDDFKTGAIGAEYLHSRGCKYPFMINGPEYSQVARKRRDGFIHFMREAGVTINSEQICYLPRSLDPLGSMKATNSILKAYPKVDGFYCYADKLALGVLRSCLEHSLVPGKDIFLIGTDNITETNLTFPPMTTIAFDQIKMGKIVALMLFKLINNEPFEEIRHVLSAHLVIRQT